MFSDGIGTDDEDNMTTLDDDCVDDFSDRLDISGPATLEMLLNYMWML